MSCPFAHSDGAYVLGALSPAERSAFQRHLAGCADCAAAVARLAPVPGLLGRVDPAALHLDPPGPHRLSRLVQAAAQRRRQERARRRRVAAAALVSALLAVAGTVGATVAVTGAGIAIWQRPVTTDPALDPAPDPATGPPAALEAAAQPMQPVAAAVPVTAQVGLAETAAGTEVWMRCAYPAVDHDYPPRVFRLFAIGADGSQEQVGSWLAGPGDEVTMTGVTRLTGTDLVRLELRGSDDARLLSYELP